MPRKQRDDIDFRMSPEEFRECGHRLVDWIANYWQHIDQYPVLSACQPGDIRAQLPAAAPQWPEPYAAWMKDFEEVILPGLTHWQSPNFFAYFPANISGPSVLGELLSAGLGAQGMLWITSPACTELETHVLDWLADALGLPESFRSAGSGGGVIQDTASAATLCALVAARDRATDGESRRIGARAPLTAYTSTEAHSSVAKAMMIAGLGRDNLRLIDTDDQMAMKADELGRCVAQDRASGHVPFFVGATIGTTSTHGIDPIGDIGAICRREGLWLHIDAAMAGTAALCPELRWIHAGVEAADSYVVNPHKWMFTNFDCSAFYVRDRDALTAALRITPEYLRNEASERNAVLDYRDWQIPLGRRFRSIKLWFVLRHYGLEGLRHHIRAHIALAQELGERIDAHPNFELAVSPPLNLLCFRLRGSDEQNRALLERLNRSGRLYLTHTRMRGQFVLRMCIGQTNTQTDHVEHAWAQIQRLGGEILAK